MWLFTSTLKKYIFIIFEQAQFAHVALILEVSFSKGYFLVPIFQMLSICASIIRIVLPDINRTIKCNAEYALHEMPKIKEG